MTIALQSVSHVGIRVAERSRSLAFYALFGFRETAWHETPRVSVLRNEQEMELNLIVNADAVAAGNVLMDVAAKHPGYTHIAFYVASLEAAMAALQQHGIAISEGPVKLGEHILACFVRDPDANVIELDERIVS
jgi:catechol 2,3-dioxygenase-like lactoylglutathione lyase family enzyme